ncbi:MULTISPECIES: carbohydrate ABC transporter permease [Rathayibacter]|jgi:multiple sugar transport system permease protein|uniref:carbohydrate ABC transporter permease n=1 Tax=Rathayibacter TaxID=33886 RepID=UPI0006F6A351|nr:MULTISPECIES: sugar ABC transporter permease [Rathayibacter]KQQ08681.1 ABC transporter permease [Rathayibacter sp. Leaf296]KQQ20571.1 ABC transporter permease [Rathayibacter sp. Leaf299]MBO0983603.1 sugar ABC transporter permease [Rathayibacter sp. SD072]MCJ1697532.1 sugar ABC transporter permease [Rathayibacter caricis]OOB91743.1 ABC transporter permease [Rathayibacter sp. VKM Ac-2630]
MTTLAAADAGTSTPPPKRRRSAYAVRNTLIGYTFILPNFLGFAALTLVPVITLFYMSLTDWNVFGQANWVGLANFQRLLGDGSFRIALTNTLYYAALHIPLTLIVSLGLALLLNNKLRGVAFFRTAAFFPYITSIVAIAVVWNLLFSPEYGPINEILRAVGFSSPPGWLTSSEWAMPAVVIISTWRDMGYYMILFLAGLQTVPRELHEAARVDGASVWQRFVNVTIPCLRPTTFFVTVMLTINSFKIFDLILVMTQGGPGQATLVLSQFIYQKGFQENQFGYASAVSVVLFLLCIVVTLVQFFLNRRSESR